MIIFASAFRPFFLLAALTAAVLIPGWLLVLDGGLLPAGPLSGMLWHAHEMVFGYATAVMAGFFLTAVPKWTDSPPIRPAPLAALAALWIVGRVAIGLSGVLPPALVAALDWPFVPILALLIGVPIVRSRSWRNLGFPFLLLGMAVANAVVHLQALDLLEGDRLAPERVALWLMLVILVVFGGRVTRLFTANALRGEATVREMDLRDRLAVASATAVPLAMVLTDDANVLGAVVAVAAVLNGVRMTGWATWATRTRPIVWVLHLGYAWIAASMALVAFAHFSPFSFAASTAQHALTVGAIGTLTLAMLTRVTLGHTGAPLRADRATTAIYLLILGAALMRVVPLLFTNGLQAVAWHGAGTLWTAAFAVYLWRYGPKLLRPRADGRPG